MQELLSDEHSHGVDACSVHGSWHQLHTHFGAGASECWRYEPLLLMVRRLLMVVLLLQLLLHVLLCRTVVRSDHCIHLLLRHIVTLPLPLECCRVDKKQDIFAVMS